IFAFRFYQESWYIWSLPVTARNLLFSIFFSVNTFDDHAVSTYRIYGFGVFSPFSFLIAAIWDALHIVLNMHDGINRIASELKLMERIVQHQFLSRNAILYPNPLQISFAFALHIRMPLAT